MDYKKKYDEALKCAKMYYKENKDYNAGFLPIIFPELAESEDERIRTELLSSFKGIMADADEDELWYGLPYNDMIAWLEKQKEQKPTEWSEENYDKISQLVYKAIRKTLASLAVYAENEALLDSKEETLSYYSQQCAEKILKFLRPSWKPSDQ